MLIYIFIASFLFFGYFVPKKFNNVYYNISLILLFAFTAFRNVNLGGYDAENYQSFFIFKVPYLKDFLKYNSEYEYGFGLFSSIIKTMINDYRFFQISYTLLSIILLKILIKKLEFRINERNLFLFIYFCYRYLWNSFVLLRQNIAVLVIWIAFFTLLNKPVRYYFNLIVTFFWHKSSIVNIFVFPMIRLFRNIGKKKLILITTITSVFLLIFSQPIFNLLLLFLTKFTGMKYNRYFWGLNEFESMNYINYSLKWIFVLIFYFNYDRIKYIHKELILYLSFIVLLMSSINTAIVSRMVEYYMISVYVMITTTNQIFKGISKVFYVIGIYLLFIIILIRFLHTFNGGELLDYNFFFMNS